MQNLNNSFDWGVAAKNKWFKDTVEKEIFIDDIYQKFFKVDQGDIVFDVGASAGPFTYHIKSQNPQKVYCFEPHPELFQTLLKNVSDSNVVCVNKAILEGDGLISTMGLFNETLTGMCMKENEKIVESVSFNSFIKENNIKKIDFLKTDCEGGEYDIFNDENLSWIKNNVKKIVGEWHLFDSDQKNKFRKFRDTYLKQFPNHQIFSVDNVDIKHDLWSDWFIQYYGIITVYIDNRNYVENKKPKWKYAHFPTLEITTSIPRSGCVVDCVFCPQRTLQKKYQGERFLSLENYKKVIDKVPSEVRITFAGFTEPWLNKHCTDMVLYAHEKGHPISVFTTGIGMTIEDFERIRHIPFAPNPNGGFVLHVPDQERRAKHPITPKYIELLRHIQTTHFGGRPIQNYCWMAMGTPHETIQEFISSAQVNMMWSRAGNLLGEAMMKPELMNLKNHFGSIYHGEVNMTCGCEERLYHNILLPNGDVSLCCMDYNLDHILGNLLEEEYNDILPEPYSCFNLCRLCENAISPENEIILNEKKEYNLV